jgi:hypothetical protein
MCTCSLCRCQVAVHQECYGAKNVQDFTSWVCRVCETPEVERECCLCPVKGMSSTFNIFFGLTIFAVLLHYIRFVWKVVTFESSKIILQWEIGNFSFLSWLAWLYHVLLDLCMQSLYPIFLHSYGEFTYMSHANMRLVSAWSCFPKPRGSGTCLWNP